MPAIYKQPYTPTELAIIDYLNQSAGPRTRKEIAEHVFKKSGIESNVVDVHVKNIRGKAGASFILTSRGVGYELNKHDTQ